MNRRNRLTLKAPVRSRKRRLFSANLIQQVSVFHPTNQSNNSLRAASSFWFKQHSLLARQDAWITQGGKNVESRGSSFLDGRSELILSLARVCLLTASSFLRCQLQHETNTHVDEHTGNGWQNKKKASALNKVHFLTCPGSGLGASESSLCGLGWGEGVFWVRWWVAFSR